MYVTGQVTRMQAKALDDVHGLSEKLPLKCGTPAVMDFVINRDKLDPEILHALGVEIEGRPTYTEEETYDSPGGQFKIHYTTTGIHAVYHAGDDRDGDGVPDYVEDMSLVLDSVHNHIVNTLGYPPPPDDSFYPSGGDEKYDIYISNLLGPYFGLTYPDSLSIDGPGSIRATSFIKLENDYQEMSEYRNRPLDAVRVTIAHEYFHAVQFGIDFTETEVDTSVSPPFARRYWMEMSAVWMEEEIYDDINDYYFYLDSFFVNPRLSIQQFKNSTDLHPYASVVFPIFLSETFGRDIIRDIWLRCGDMGAGPHFLVAAELAIDSISGGSEGWPSAFRDFALWNYFTGDRAYDAPDGVGYSEKEQYPSVYDTAIIKNTQYPILVQGNQNPYKPEHNSAAYLRLNHTRAIKYDTTFWICNSGSFDDSTCTDSTLVEDTTTGYEIMHVDSLLDFYVGLGDGQHLIPPQPWGLSIVYRLDSIPDSFVVDQIFLPYIQPPPNNLLALLRFINPNQYRSVTMILSPASYRYEAYETPPYDYSFSYYIPEYLDSARIDTPIVNIMAARLVPYPNPAVVADMGGLPLNFKFELLTESYSHYGAKAVFKVDVFNVAGEFVRGFNATVIPQSGEKKVEFVTSWDMKNERGRAVASGVYIAVARLYSEVKSRELLAEGRVKVAIIR